MKNLKPFIFVFASLMLGIVISCKEEEVPLATEVTIQGLLKTIPENPAHQTMLGKVVATTTQGTLTYAITEQNPAGAMAINASTGEVTVADTAMFDFETYTELEATASATAEGVNRTAEILIKLTDVDDAPPGPVSITDLTLEVEENPTQGQVLDTLEATAETGTLSYSLVSQTVADALEVDATNGELKVDDPGVFDYETNPTLEAQIAATNGTDSDTASVTINLVDVDENVFSVQDFTTSVAENTADGTVLGKVTVHAAQGSVSYQISEQSVDGAVSINTSGELIVADVSKIDFELNQSITGKFMATNGGKSSTGNFTIIITDISITAEDFTIDIDENPANEAAIGKVSVQPDTSAITYAILSQSVAGSVSINGTGELVVADANKFDYETIQSITGQYTATLRGEMDTASFTVNIQDVSEATVAATDFTATVDENLANSTVIGTVSANITSGTGTLTYSIVSQSVSGAVSINTNGQILVANPSAFDYENQTQISGTYRAAVGSNGDNASFTIAITDIDEHVVTAQDFTVSIDENSPNGTSLGAPTVTLTGGTGSYVYTILSQSVPGAIGFTNNGAFEITDPNAFDYETHTQITGTYEVEVSGSASANAVATANFTIDINDKFSWTKTVFAGQAGTFSNTNGTGNAARFNEPVGMSFDPSGNNLYVADKNNHRIRKINISTAAVTTFAGSTQGRANGTGTSAQFDSPRDVEVDAGGSVWVADHGNSSLRKINVSGQVTRPSSLGFAPNGLAVVNRHIYISRDHQIWRWEDNFNRLTNYNVGGNSAGFKDGTASQILLSNPRGIDFSSTGELLIADYSNKRIREVTSSKVSSSYTGAYFQVTDVETAPDGNIYAVEAGNKRVRLVTSNLTTVEEILVSGFNRPEGIAIHPINGDIYISDTGAHCIYKLERVEE